MSKEYKLKKWYPSLPEGYKEGRTTVKQFTKNRETYYPMNGMAGVPSEEVENNPEFWELVEKEQKYKIVSFQEDETGDIANIQKNGCYQKAPIYTEDELGSTLDDMLDSDGWDVFAIERFPDNEIFAVGDTVSKVGETEKYTIKGFSIDSRKPLVHIVRGSKSHNISMYRISSVDILFTDDNDRHVHKGDDYYCIDSRYRIVKCVADGVPNNKNTLARFKDVGEAKAWIEDNKPQYSMKEIDRALNKAQIHKGSYHIKSIHISEFHRLLKEEN